MELDPRTRERSMYRTLTGTVVPRPIGWVSTTGPEGVDNLAPYSFFTVASVDPPVLLFSAGDRPDRPEGLSDSARNARATGEFVVNVVTEPFAEAMNETSATLPPGDSEFDHADLDRAGSVAVTPPRVAGIEVAYECRLRETVDVGSNTLVLGEVVYAHVSDDLLTDDGKVDVERVDAVGRLAGSHYCHIGDRFRMERPD